MGHSNVTLDCNAWTQKITDILEYHDIAIHQADGLKKWFDLWWRASPDIQTINPALAPANAPHDDKLCRSVWLTKDGETLAWIGMRVDTCEDYVQLLFDWIAEDDAARRARMRVDPDVSKVLPLISGKVVHSGGAWVLPESRGLEYNGQRMAFYLTRLIRLVALAEMQVDWVVGLVIAAPLREKKVAQRIHGYPNVEVVMREFPFPYGLEAKPLQLKFMNREETNSGLRDDFS
jgi:hypothetical protein